MLKLKKQFFNSIFYLVSCISFLSIFLLLINFEKLSTNIFSLNYMFNIESNPYNQLSLGLLTTFLVTIIIYLSKNNIYLNTWLIKLFVTVFVAGLFEYLYVGLDQFGYVVNAIYDYHKLPFFQSGNGFIIGVNHFLTYLGGDSFYSLKIINSFISFLSLILLYKTYVYILKKENLENVSYLWGYCLFISPTVLFWTSLIGKDSLIIFPIALFIFSCIKFLDEKKFIYFLMIIISIIVAYYIRRWIPIIMVGTLFFYNIRLNKKNLILLSLFAIVLCVLSFFVLKTLNIQSINEIFVYLGNLSQTFSRGNTAMEVYKISNFFDYCIYYFPNLFTALFLPLPNWGTSNIFLWLFSFENLIILCLFIFYVVFNIKLIFSNRYLKFLFLFIFSWSLIYVILSPGNLGTAIRYKSQIWPILIMLILVSLHIVSFFKSKKER